MRVLITGGAGFIGSHLVDYIQSNSQTNILILDNLSAGREGNVRYDDNKSINIIEDDIQNSDLINELVEMST